MNGKKVIRGAMLLAFMVTSTAYGQQELGDANPLSGDAKAIRSGKSWFRNTCTPCHGGRADGMGDMGTGADLRKLTIGFKGYYDTVKNGRKVQGRAQFMPSFSFLDDKTIFEIGAYLETLALEGANWKEGVVNK
ncbi:MAG: c-type cytochrome [Burkholderiales bacterium]